MRADQNSGLGSATVLPASPTCHSVPGWFVPFGVPYTRAVPIALSGGDGHIQSFLSTRYSVLKL